MTIIPISSRSASPRPPATWLQLPIAPRAQAGLRFASPGKPGRTLLLAEAMGLIDQTLEQGRVLEMVELTGPGDPLATPDLTLECVMAIRNRYPELPITISTLGLGIKPLFAELVGFGVHFNLQVDAVRPEVVAKIFTWVRPEKKTIPLTEVAPLLVEEQAKAIRACVKAITPLTISSTVYPGLNDEHIEEIARTVAKLGADTMTLRPFISCGAEDEPLGPTNGRLITLAGLVTKHLALAEAPVTIGTSRNGSATGCASAPDNRPRPRQGRANVAVLSGNGMDIDLHLGQAIKALIYGPRQDGLACLLEARDLPEPGGGDGRWQKVAGILDDCFVLLAASAGQKPREILGRHGLALLITDENIEGTVEVLFGGDKKRRCTK